MRDFLYIAPSFTHSECIDSIMSIRISAGGLCFCIKNGGEVKFLLSQNETLSSDEQRITLIEELFIKHNLSEVKFKEIKVYHALLHKMLIPGCEVENGNYKVWLKTLTGVSMESTLLRQVIPMCDCEVFAPLSSKLSLFLERFGRVDERVITAPFICNSITSVPKGNKGHWIFVEYSAGVLDVLVTKGKKMVFFNSYQVTKAEEALYYVLQVARLHSLNESVNAVFSGEIESHEELIFATLKRYLPMFTIAANIELKGICSEDNIEAMPLFVHLLE
ncbi:MAG: DUF3822 family protein [Marinifilaceae bacterium]|nr:DUF3822 family protein [Marinifilaceae bacterium]